MREGEEMTDHAPAGSRRALAIALAAAIALLLVVTTGGPQSLPKAKAAAGSLRFRTVKLKGADGGTEPRIAVGPRNWRWAITNEKGTGTAIAYKSQDGFSWTRTKADPAGQSVATIDVDIVRTHDRRTIANELDLEGINFRTSYTDDGGKTWTESEGATLGDTDRQWLAVGPDDPETHKANVYLMFHNLASGAATHNMFVQRSNDGGETFNPPVPITLPPDEAFLDLQCSDSGGPSSLMVNKKNGWVYAVWGTRHSPSGGCGAQPPEANVVAATRVWVARSKDHGDTWETSLAVDKWETGQVVGMQLAPGALDNRGNVYVVYPESPNPYPDYTGAAVKYRWAPKDLSKWSKPVTVSPPGGAGSLLPHIVVGDPGKIDIAWFKGKTREGDLKPAWYTTVAQTLNGLRQHPSFSRLKVSDIPTYTGTASELMGVCDNPGGGFTCPRSTDVWGIDLDLRCKLMIAWPTTANDAEGSRPGTYVSTQTGGKPVCSSKTL